MKHRKAKPESKPTPPVRWIPVLDIQDLAAVKTREEIVAIIEAAKIALASSAPPRVIPVFTADEAAQIRRADDSLEPSPDAPNQPEK